MHASESDSLRRAASHPEKKLQSVFVKGSVAKVRSKVVRFDPIPACQVGPTGTVFRLNLDAL